MKKTSSTWRLSLVAVAVLLAWRPGYAQLAANALPTGGQVVSGNATLATTGNTLNINQGSQRAIVNFTSFNVGSAAVVDVRQLNSSSALLARTSGGDPSQIQGQIKANGAVWLVNPAGIMVGPGARIDVGQFVASTLKVSDQDFAAGKLTFQGDANTGTVRNLGHIQASQGGSVYLVGANVENHGVIQAPNGEVILAAGQTVQLMDTGTPGVSVAITGSAGTATNLGRITAEAGRIGLAAGLVNNSGQLNASSVVNEGGRIFLRASNNLKTAASSQIEADGTSGGRVALYADNTAAIDGTISAQGSAGPGGFVETSGRQSLEVVKVPTVGRGGEWLIDPYSITIQSGSGMAGAAGTSAIVSNESGAWIGADTITDQLNAGTNVSITTGNGMPATDHGNITVAAAIAKTAGADATLSLNANNNIAIHGDITSSSGALNLNLNSNRNGDYADVDHSAELHARIDLNGGALSVREGAGSTARGAINIGESGRLVLGQASSSVSASSLNVQAGGTLEMAGGANLDLSGPLQIDGGSVSLQSALQIGSLAITAGNLQSTAGLNVTDSYTQSGGSLQLADASLNQASGDLQVGSINAANLLLRSQTGAVRQNDEGLRVSGQLITSSATGTTLVSSANRITAIATHNTGSGDIVIANTTPSSATATTLNGLTNAGGNISVDNNGATLSAAIGGGAGFLAQLPGSVAVTGLSSTGAISAPAGTVTVVAHSPLSIGSGGVSAASHIVLSAGDTGAATDNLLIDGTVVSNGGNITLTAGNNITLNVDAATVAPGAVSYTATRGVVTTPTPPLPPTPIPPPVPTPVPPPVILPPNNFFDAPVPVPVAINAQVASNLAEIATIAPAGPVGTGFTVMATPPSVAADAAAAAAAAAASKAAADAAADAAAKAAADQAAADAAAKAAADKAASDAAAKAAADTAAKAAADAAAKAAADRAAADAAAKATADKAAADAAASAATNAAAADAAAKAAAQAAARAAADAAAAQAAAQAAAEAAARQAAELAAKAAAAAQAQRVAEADAQKSDAASSNTKTTTTTTTTAFTGSTVSVLAQMFEQQTIGGGDNSFGSSPTPPLIAATPSTSSNSSSGSGSSTSSASAKAEDKKADEKKDDKDKKEDKKADVAQKEVKKLAVCR